MKFESILAMLIAAVMLLGGMAIFIIGITKGKEHAKKDGVLFIFLGIVAMIVKFIIDNFA